MTKIEILGANRFETYTKTRGASRAVIVRDGMILLVHESASDLWIIPGGGIEEGETPEKCCVREAEEETGNLVLPLQEFTTLFEYYEEYCYITHYFICEVTGSGRMQLTEAEVRRGAEPRWIPFSEAMEIFSRHQSYADVSEEKRGIYLREYTALQEYLKNQPQRKMKRESDTNDYIIRPERTEDHGAVENMIRESFWNVYRPGCSEHYVIHVLRDDPAFIKELDFVMEKDGQLIGQNMFMKTVIIADDGRTVPVLTMGPICITPERKRMGYGKKLLDHSLEKAAALGYGAVLFEGNIGFYGKSGFDYARKFGIRYHDLPEGADDSFFLCRELIPGYLDDVTGVYQTPQGYYVDDADVEEFDKLFPPKVKRILPGQLAVDK